MNGLFLFLLDMPPAVKGQVRPNAEGDYYIFLNAAYNAEQRRETYNHEVRHLLLGHHTIEETPVAELERQANCKAALLAQIRAAEENGLPLETALLARRPGPPAAHRAETRAKAKREDETGERHRPPAVGRPPAPGQGSAAAYTPYWWAHRLKSQARGTLTHLWY